MTDTLQFHVYASRGPRGGPELVPCFDPDRLAASDRDLYDALLDTWGTESGTIQLPPYFAPYFVAGETVDEDALKDRFTRAFEDLKEAVDEIQRAMIPALNTLLPVVENIIKEVADAINTEPS